MSPYAGTAARWRTDHGTALKNRVNKSLSTRLIVKLNCRWRHQSPHIRVSLAALQNSRRCAQVMDSSVGTASDEHLIHVSTLHLAHCLHVVRTVWASNEWLKPVYLN